MTWEEQLQQAFETAASRLKYEVAREFQSLAEGVASQVRRERGAVLPPVADSAVEDARPDAPPSAVRLLDAVRSLDQAGSLSEVLDRLVTSATIEAGRVGLFLASADELRGWRFVGFDSATAVPSSIVVSLKDDGVLSQAVRTRGAAAVDAAVPAHAAPAFAAPGGGEGVALPVTIGGEVVAVLYADRDAAGMRRDAVAAWAEAIELLCRHAARCLEAKTALNAVQALSDRPPTPQAPEPRPPAPLAFVTPPRAPANLTTALRPANEAVTDEESALRYAELLVLEIQTYNETAVAAGRRDGNLTARLGGEIARARLLYEERVPPKIRARRDYFGDELVRTLANGDPRLLAASPVLGLRN
jgi:hypothetical protein